MMIIRNAPRGSYPIVWLHYIFPKSHPLLIGSAAFSMILASDWLF